MLFAKVRLDVVCLKIILNLTHSCKTLLKKGLFPTIEIFKLVVFNSDANTRRNTSEPKSRRMLVLHHCAKFNVAFKKSRDLVGFIHKWKQLI